MGINWFLTVSASAVAAFIVAAVCWLVREVLDIRRQLVELESRLSGIERECEKRLSWTKELSDSIARIDRNLVRLCEKNNVEFEGP